MTNFKWKSGQTYRFVTGYKVYEDSTSTEPIMVGDGYYQNFKYEFADEVQVLEDAGANMAVSSIVGAGVGVVMAVLAFVAF